MAGSGHLRSTNLRVMRDNLDSLKGMITELKRGSRRLKSQINTAVRKLKECKKMRDELNDLVTSISNCTHINTMQPERNSNESLPSLEEDLGNHEEKNIDLVVVEKKNSDLVNHENNNMDFLSTEMSYEINSHINSGEMPIESFHPDSESLASMESGDRLAESLDDSMESFYSSEEDSNSFMDYYDSSEDKFLDAEDDNEWFERSSPHKYSERSILEDAVEPVPTTSKTGENSNSFEREKANHKEEDMIIVWVNEYKRKLHTVPSNINVFENLHVKNETNVNNATLTYDNSEAQKIEKFDSERKSIGNPSLNSNVNFSGDSFDESSWSMNIETTVTVNLKSLEEQQTVEKKSKCFEKGDELCCDEESFDNSKINSHQELNCCENFQDEIVIKIEKIENENSKSDKREEFSLEKESFIGSWMNSFRNGNASGDNQNQMNENANQLLMKNFFQEQKNVEHHDKEVDGAFADHNWSSFGLVIKRYENCPISENICNSSEYKFDKNIKFGDSWENSQPHTFSTYNYDDINFHEVNTAILNDYIYPVEKKSEDLGNKNKKQEWKEMNSFLKVNNWTGICEETEIIKNSSELSTDDLHLPQEVPQNFGPEIKCYENCPRIMVSSENICGSSENEFDINIKLGDSWENFQQGAFSTNYNESINLHEVNIAMLDDDIYPAEKRLENFGNINEKQEKNEINSFPKIKNRTVICEKNENFHISSELSTDVRHLLEEVVQNFDEEKSLSGCLETDSLSQIACIRSSYDDIPVHVNAVSSPTENPVALEVKNTVSLASASEVPEKVNNVPASNLLNPDIAE